MNSMYFTEEHQLFRASFRDFLQKEVVPYIEQWEKTEHKNYKMLNILII